MLVSINVISFILSYANVFFMLISVQVFNECNKSHYLG